MKPSSGWLICAIAFAAVGCGGSAANGPAPTARPALTVDWPARGRDIFGPSSALSCQFTLQAVNFTAPPIVFSGNRPNGSTPVNTPYTAGVRGKAGTWHLTGNFYPVAGEFGNVVGTVDVQVRIQRDGSLTNTDGTALSFSFSPVIVYAQVSAGQLVQVGATTPLESTAYDSNLNIVVVTPGSFTYSGGSSALSVAASGFATGLAIGTGQVVASIDGVSSPQQSVSVSPAFKTIAISTNDFAYDSQRDTLWVSPDFSAFQYFADVVPVNATTGKIGTPVSINDFANFMAVTNDNQYLYVSGLSGTLYRLVLPAGTIDQTITLPANTTVAQVAAVPGTQNSVAVVLVNANDGVTDMGTYIYDVATARANSANVGASIAFNDSGTRIYGYQRFQQSGSLYYSANVDSTGIAGANSTVTALQGFGNRIHWINGKILGDDGNIVDPDTGTLLGALSFQTTGHVAAPVPATNFSYYASWDPMLAQEYDIGSQTNLLTSPLGNIDGGIDKAIYLGNNRVALRQFGGSANAVFILRGLPN